MMSLLEYVDNMNIRVAGLVGLPLPPPLISKPVSHLRKSKMSVASLVDFLRVQGHTESSYPGVPLLNLALTALLLP